MKTIFAIMITLGGVLAAQAQLHTQAVEYKDGDATLEGYLAYDDSAAQGKRPGVLIVHQWMGLTDYEKERAEMLAKMGYVVFAADIYGKGIRPKDRSEAGKQAGKYKNDRALLRERANAALRVLEKNERTDHE